MNWIFETVFVHIMFLGSIFVIYFRSPVIQNLRPTEDIYHPEPPAKRLVLFVTDGLGADYFFSRDCGYIPNIRKILLSQGMVGISTTRVPTESRPGHIAMIAGLYEDPTAVLKGWRENPIDFDSVFNRSRQTYAWGSNDILSIFSKADIHNKMLGKSYGDDLDFSGKQKTYNVDTWVFSEVDQFLRNNGNSLQDKSKQVFFLHLLGMDTAGHIHKPGSKLFLENLEVVDKRLLQTYGLFEKTFNDKRTAYILTSDHGMTSTGSHGGGDVMETETPLFVWGAGIRNWKSLPSNNVYKQISQTICGTQIPSYDVEQADIAPLMATLIGTAVPVNNYGKLPWKLLNTSDEYTLKAMRNNALQMFSQYEKLSNEFNKGLFSKILRSFYKDDLQEVIDYAKHLSPGLEINQDGAIAKLELLIEYCLEGIEYYQSYYQRFLLFCTTTSFCCWIFHLILMVEHRKEQPTISSSAVVVVAFGLMALIGMFVYLQGIALVIGAYFLFPIVCCMRVMQKINFNSITETLVANWKFILGMMIIAELLVYTFYKREAISIAYLVYAIFQHSAFKNVKHIEAYKSLYYEWLLSGIFLLVFPNIPLTYLKKNDALLMFGGLLWITKICLDDENVRNNRFLQFFCFLGFAHCLVCLYLTQLQTAVYRLDLLISWVLSAVALVGPVFFDVTLKHRTASIFFYFGIPYLHLSISYEMIFFTLFGTHILSFIELNAAIDQQMIPKTMNRQHSNEDGHLGRSLNISLAMLLFVFLSFFGTGNIASVSSFDPGIVRFFVQTFSPFVIMGLIILKLAIPLILVISAFTGLTYRRKIDEKKVILSLMIICDIVGLNFLFMVTNKGSWRDIGMSISQFVIMEVTTLVMAIVSYCSKFLLFVDMSKIIRLKAGKLI